MVTHLVMTVLGDDRPGIVRSIADQVAAAGGNWQESRMAHLAGKFAGIVLVAVHEPQSERLVAALRSLDTEGLRVLVEPSASAHLPSGARVLALELIGPDRPGIVREVSQALAERGVGIEELATEAVSGSWSGESLFKASARLSVPRTVSTEALRHALGKVSNDLGVDLRLEERAAPA